MRRGGERGGQWPPLRKKKSSAVPHFRSGRRSPIFAGLTNRGKAGVQRGREPQVSLPFCPRRGRGSLTRSAERSSPLRFSENLPARTGRIANATRVPHKPVQKRRCPDRVNRLRGSGVQPSLCRKMGAQKISDKTKQARIKPSLLCCDREV